MISPPPIFENINVYLVDWFYLSKFIKEKIGHEYDLLSLETVYNDTLYLFFIDDQDQDSIKVGIKETEAFINGEDHCCVLNDILLYLYYKGEIPPGKYLVHVCW